jgi:hypothetical protein
VTELVVTKAEVRGLIDELFEKEGLVIGGLVAVHQIDGELVWSLVRRRNVICGKVLRRAESKASVDRDDAPAPRTNLKLPTASEEFRTAVRGGDQCRQVRSNGNARTKRSLRWRPSRWWMAAADQVLNFQKSMRDPERSPKRRQKETNERDVAFRRDSR